RAAIDARADDWDAPVNGIAIGRAFRIGIAASLMGSLALGAARAWHGRLQAIQAGNRDGSTHRHPTHTPTRFLAGVAAAARARVIAMQPSMKFSGSAFSNV